MTDSKNTNPRPPVVVVMGHVDHGKTTLLDYIRKANVAEREAGGITQAVGAYEIAHAGKKITFIDTPGHEAFISMRSRGAAIADLAILVVAADEGVKPQTKEAIGILQKSETPFVVAITKTDKPGANIDKVKNELAEASALLEGYGGQVSWHGVSSKTGEGVNDLLDLVLLAAEVEGLIYDPSAPASGFVLEARKDRRRGVEATVIVENGILKRGDAIATPTASGKVKILEDFLGKPAGAIEPSAPARIVGFDDIPSVGEEFRTGSEAAAVKAKKPAGPPAYVGASAGRRLARAGRGVDSKQEEHILRIMLKAGDAGSLEALSTIIRGIAPRETNPVRDGNTLRALAVSHGARLEIVSESVGDITDGDVKEAIATDAAIVGFKVKLEKGAANLADAQHVCLVTSDIVYDLEKAVEEFVKGAGEPEVVGILDVLAVFSQEKLEKQLVGGKVVEGVIRNRSNCEIIRVENETEKILGAGKILNLRDKKADVAQMEKGKEAGVLVEAAVEIEKGDKLVMREKK